MAHSLHVGCFPLCVQYTVHWWVPRLGCLDSQTACILWPQLINIQVSEIAFFHFAWPLVGGSVSPVVWRVGCVGKFVEIDNSRNFWLVGFAWGQPSVAWSGRRFHQSCRDSRGERTRLEAIECYTASDDAGIGKYRRLYWKLYGGWETVEVWFAYRLEQETWSSRGM